MAAVAGSEREEVGGEWEDISFVLRRYIPLEVDPRHIVVGCENVSHGCETRSCS